MLDNLSQPVAFATIPLTSSVEQKGEDQGLLEPLGTASKEDLSHRPGLQDTNETVQAALEDQLALALDDDDDDFLSGMLSGTSGFFTYF